MASMEVVQWNALDTVAAVARRIIESTTPRATLAPVRAAVPECRCSGSCRCGTLVPYLLQRQIELECEFYRDVH